MNKARKKYIIAGCGEFGKLALKKYGCEEVACFVDNNKEKQGLFIDGIEVCSFELLEKCDFQYTVVIAVNNYETIMKQLESMQIKNYYVFSPTLNNRIKALPNKTADNDTIILFGYDVYTNQIIDEVIKKGWDKKSIVLAERPRIIEEKDLSALNIQDINELNTDNSVIIVSSVIYAYGIEQYKKRLDIKSKEWINLFVDKTYYPENQVIINSYVNEANDVTEEKWIRDRNSLEARDSLADYFEELSYSLPLFSHIEIETVNRCNGKCSFCPVSVGHDIRPYTVMEDSLFYKIIDDLASLNYSGKIALFSNNEPFIDKRIIYFHEYARKKLPLARFHLYTNGTLLTLEKFIATIDYLDELIIDNYNQQLELNNTSNIIYEYVLEHPELQSKVSIVIRKEEEILNTRGGEAPNRDTLVTYDDITCTHPLRQMIIRPDGKVSLCCNDPYGKITLGDVNKNSLLEVWNGEEFKMIRSLLKEGRGNLDICKYCDFFGCK